MKNINTKKFLKGNYRGNIIILAASILILYLVTSFYFTNHFFFNTVINGVNVSLRAHDDVEGIIRSYIKNYKLQLIGRSGEVEEIKGQDIGLQYNKKNNIDKIYQIQESYKWIGSIFKQQKYYVKGLFIYDIGDLNNKINQLNCLNKTIIEPQNVRFKYLNGSYEVIQEVYGNRINVAKLNQMIEKSVLKGVTKLDLNENLCYEDPRYTLRSDKVPETKDLLNKYVSTKITYTFGSKTELLDGDIINKWLGVDENLEVVINETAVMRYVKDLGKKYDTVGAARTFKTSMGKIVEVKGGLYGWKINYTDETKALLENIKLGKVIEKEPIYAQKALSRDGNEIGNSYVEVNITRQHLWFYKDGRFIAGGGVVTGNPNKGHSTKLGTYMLNYKEEGATLIGPGYESEVTYWMPFYGNIGIHDATWRYSFGGEIYKRNGSHGCINVPLYLAKRIYDNIEEGTPIICYEE